MLMYTFLDCEKITFFIFILGAFILFTLERFMDQETKVN